MKLFETEFSLGTDLDCVCGEHMDTTDTDFFNLMDDDILEDLGNLQLNNLVCPKCGKVWLVDRGYIFEDIVNESYLIYAPKGTRWEDEADQIKKKGGSKVSVYDHMFTFAKDVWAIVKEK